MKKLIILSLAMGILVMNTVQAQVPNPIPYDKVFVKLSTGEFLIGMNLLTTDGPRHNRISLDGKLFKKNSVRFYNNGVLYASKSGSKFLSTVLRKNNLNFFETTYEAGQASYSPYGAYRGTSQTKVFYYSNELNRLKKIKPLNLAKDMRESDNPEAYAMIKQARKSSLISLGSFLSFYPVVFLGVVSPVPQLAAVALIPLTTGIIYLIKKRRQTRKALILYAPELPKYLPDFFSKKQRKAAEYLLLPQ